MPMNSQAQFRQHSQSGGTLMGFVLGLLLGLAIAVGVAITLTRGAPEPKLNLRAPELSNNKAPVAQAIDEGEIQVEERVDLKKPLQSKSATAKKSKDPIAAIADSAQGAEYWLQTGAFRNQDEAQRQKASLAMQGLEAVISEREVDGSILWRVRVGPFIGQDEVVQKRAQLQSASIPSTVIRINKAN